MNIIVVANSPGEVAGWASPLIKEISCSIKDARVFLFLLPCSFATGFEFDFAKKISGLDEILKPKETLKLIFLNKIPDFIDFKEKGAIVHLGGDLFFTSRLAAKTKYPAFAYIWANKLWDKKFSGYFARESGDSKRLLMRGISEEKIHIVGELLIDNFKGFTYKKEKGKTIVFMPGSRQREIEFILPFYLKVAEILSMNFKNINFKLILSPFINLKEFYKKAIYNPDKKFAGTRAIINKEEGKVLSERASMEIITEDHYRHLLASDFVITIPGTKTGEAGIAAVPMLVIVPLNRAEEVPFTGLVGLLDWFGKPLHFLKALIIKSIAKRFGFTSQPNILAARQIVPEMVRELTPEEVAEEAVKLIKDEGRTRKMKEELAEIYSPLKGASKKIIEVIKNIQ